MSSTMIKVMNFDHLQRDLKSNAIVIAKNSKYKL